jgi:hypothetical protein
MDSNNVVAEIHHANGEIEYIYSPFPVESRWPGILVDSSSFNLLPTAEKFYRQAMAYLQAAVILCEVAGDAGSSLQWSQGAVCYYCLNIATELFLKACIQESKYKTTDSTHKISDLIVSYREILPQSEFHFVTFWEMSWAEIEKVLGVKLVAKVDHHPDQLFRYGADQSGKGSAGIQFFSPDTFHGYLRYLKPIWERAWNKVANA